MQQRLGRVESFVGVREVHNDVRGDDVRGRDGGHSERERVRPPRHVRDDRGQQHYLDYQPINGNPDAVLLVTRLQDSGGDVVPDAHPIGVWYDANRGSWAIFNQDLVPMSEGATFSVVALEEPGEALSVHRATLANTTGNATYVDYPSANERPDAVLAVTPNWNPGGGDGTYNNHPVGVRYDAEEEWWTILNLDLAPMPEGAAFDIAVTPAAPAG